jgi:GNAT superfamily N-acetyltransferase
MDITLRPATDQDIPDLSQLHLMAAHGFLDAVYHDALPGLRTNEIYERVLARTETVLSYKNAWVAVQERVIGEVHAFPWDDGATSPPNPFIPKDRLVLFEPLDHLDPLAAGTYHINILAVYPEFRGKGIGTKLLNLAGYHAKQRGFSKLSLFTFEDDRRLVKMYQRFGLVVIARTPVVKHELLQFSGDWILMTCSV